jgi:hypothetical protein
MRRKEMDTATVKERPILFMGDMVRAVREGRKTMTRRVIKGDPEKIDVRGKWIIKFDGLNWHDWLPIEYSPYGQPGDRLWIKEPAEIVDKEWSLLGYAWSYWIKYAADGKRKGAWAVTQKEYQTGHKFGRAFPRWASRLTLEIVSVRVERLQEISEEDAIAEGMEVIPIKQATWSNRQSFQVLWEKINAKRGYGWNVNPWVWVIEFKTVQS